MGSNEGSRESMIHLLWDGWKDKTYRLVGSIVGDRQIFLKVKSTESEGLLYVCDVPKEYKGLNKSLRNKEVFYKEF